MTDREMLEHLHTELSLYLRGSVIRVPAGGDLQGALNQAQGGTVIELEPGATYVGNFQLPAFGGAEWATLRVGGTLPPRRMTMDDAPRLATLLSEVPGVPPLVTVGPAHHWRLDGLAVTQTGGNTYGLIRLGSAEGFASPQDVPHHFELDRVLLHVGDTIQERRGLQVNATDVVLSRSGIFGIKESGADSQALCAWDTPGRLLVDDCTLEGAGENILIGGADTSLPGVVPAGIVLMNSTLSKPLAWKGGPWQVKNLLELKNARHVRIQGCLLDGNWEAAQTGYAVLFTPRNQGGTAPWSTVEDVLMEDCTIQNSGGGFNLLGTDNEHPSGRMRDITIRNILIVLRTSEFGGDGRPLLIGAGPERVTCDHWTCDADGSSAVHMYGTPSPGVVFTNCLMRHNAYGVIGEGQSPGTPSIQQFFPGSDFLHNVLADGAGYPYPKTTQLPSMGEFMAQFEDFPGGDYRLKASSPWKGAGTDGQDLGADISRLPA